MSHLPAEFTFDECHNVKVIGHNDKRMSEQVEIKRFCYSSYLRLKQLLVYLYNEPAN